MRVRGRYELRAQSVGEASHPGPLAAVNWDDVTSILIQTSNGELDLRREQAARGEKWFWRVTKEL